MVHRLPSGAPQTGDEVPRETSAFVVPFTHALLLHTFRFSPLYVVAAFFYERQRPADAEQKRNGVSVYISLACVPPFPLHPLTSPVRSGDPMTHHSDMFFAIGCTPQERRSLTTTRGSSSTRWPWFSPLFSGSSSGGGRAPTRTTERIGVHGVSTVAHGVKHRTGDESPRRKLQHPGVL